MSAEVDRADVATEVDRARLVRVALGTEPADLILRRARVVSVVTGEIVPSDIVIAGDRIAALPASGTAVPGPSTEVVDLEDRFVVPGLIDPHVHVESSNLTLTELARAIVPRGVLTLCADPHEIANVLGLAGIELFIAEAAALPFDLLLRVPGRVPALPAHLETSGHDLDLAATLALLDRPDAVALGGDINPALLLGAEPGQLAKIAAAVARSKTVGGQLPGFSGAVLDATVACGLEDTHVAESVAEVIDQMRHGLRVLLTPRPDRLPAEEWPELADTLRRTGVDTRRLVLCTDDIHPNLLQREGHLDERVRLAVRSGFDPVQAVQMATLNPAELMRIDRDRGLVAPGRLADLVVLDDLAAFTVSSVLQRGRVVAREGALTATLPPFVYPRSAMGTIRLAGPVRSTDLALAAPSGAGERCRVNVVRFGGPKTSYQAELPVVDGVVMPDASIDVAAIAVLERHRASGRVGRGFVGGLGIRGGAVASTINHDSHNIFVVGDSHESMAVAAQAIADVGGGYCAVVGTEVAALVALPIAGLLSLAPLAELAAGLDEVERVLVEQLGCSITYRPLYTLNFLCLPNIPDVGFTDRGIIETAAMTIMPAVVG